MKKSLRRNRSKKHRSDYSRKSHFERLETRQVLSVTALAPLADVTLLAGSPLHIPLDAVADPGDVLTFSATSTNTNVTTYIPEGNRSMRISVLSDDGAIDGEMVFELFEDLAPDVTGRIIELAESGFYDGIIFHRVIDDFMIQTGDPTGTGSGGSDYPDFDDQFNVDLQHNTSGVLSMAKSSDDTNNSQFFITEVATRHLDYNHSIFGQLVEGEDIREAISEADTGDDTQPDVDIVMTSVEIFFDNENGVLMLKAPEGYTGEADITVTVDDGQGGVIQQTFHVTVEPDTTDSSPFLDEVPMIRTTVDTETTLQVSATDVEGDNAYFLDDWLLDYYGLDMPLLSNSDLTYEINFDPSGLVSDLTVTPQNGLTGIHPITLATAVYSDTIDYQVVPVYIVPDTAPSAELDMTLVRDLTTVDDQGEVDALPDDQWIDEWDSFAVEIWATVTEDGSYGVHTVTTDLTFDNDLFVATEIEYGLAFTEDQTGVIDNASGTITGLGGSTCVFTIDGYPNVTDYAPTDPDNVNLYGDQRPVLVARVYFEPNTEGSGVANNAIDGYLTPQTGDLGFTFQNAQVTWSPVDATNLTTNTLQNAELWPVMFDLDDDGKVGLGDLSFFAGAYRTNVGDAGATYSWACDYDHDGVIGLGDLSFFAGAYHRNIDSPGRFSYSSNFPEAWRAVGEQAGAVLMVASTGGDSDDASSDLDADTREDIMVGCAFANANDANTTKRHKFDAADHIMRYYDR